MFELVFVLALQAAANAPSQSTARIVSAPGVPAIFVGNPCDPARAVSPAESASDSPDRDLFGRVKSEPFICDGVCELGLVVADRQQQVASLRIGRVDLSPRGTFAHYVGPSIPLSSKECNGARVVGARPVVDAETRLFYVAELTFADGRVWQMPNEEAFAVDVAREWQKRKNGRE